MGHFSCLFCSDWWSGSSLRPLVRAVVPLRVDLQSRSESTYVSCSPRWWSWSSSNHRWARSPHKPIPEGSFILFLQLNLKLPPLCEAWPDTNRGCTCVWARSSLQTDTASLSASFYPQCMLAFHASLSCELSSVRLYKHCWPVTHPLPAAMLYREPKVKKGLWWSCSVKTGSAWPAESVPCDLVAFCFLVTITNSWWGLFEFSRTRYHHTWCFPYVNSLYSTVRPQHTFS